MSANRLFDLRNINFYLVLRDLALNLWLVFIVGCIGVMGMYTYIRASYEPQYTSSAIYTVTPSESTGYAYTNVRTCESVVSVFNNLMDSDVMQNSIKNDLHISSLDADITIEQITETNLMKITSTSFDPILAFSAINSIMNNYEDLSEYLTADAVFDTLEAPSVATSPNNYLTPGARSVEFGLICAFLMAILVMLISIVRSTIKTEAAIEEEDVTLLTTVYHENKNRTMHSKIRQSVKAVLMTSPIISRRFSESINDICIRMQYEHDRHPDKNTYLFSSVCENEGKTTVAVNVAISLAREGKKVMIIDADLRKPSVYKILDIPKNNVVDVINLLQGACGLDEVMYHDKNTKLDLIMPTKGHTSTHEFIKSGAMRDLVKKCKKMADYIIVDTPPMAMLSDAEVMLDLVDFALLVVKQDCAYRKDVEKSISVIQDSNAKMLGCVMNDYRVLKFNDRRTGGYAGTTDKEVEVYE